MAIWTGKRFDPISKERLADLTRDVVHRSGTSAERRRRQYFIQKVVAAAADARSREGRSEFLKEIEDSIENHLRDLAAQASGIKRLWHRAVLRVKMRCGRAILKKIAEETGAPGLPSGNVSVSAARVAT